MPTVYGSPFDLDWTNKRVVIEYAKRLGRGQTVFKRPCCTTYSITHTARPDRYEGCEVVYQT